MTEHNINLSDKALLSQAYETFNSAVNKLRIHQKTLENEVSHLTEELSLKNQELTNILDSLNNGIILTNLQGQILSFNKFAYDITQFEQEEVYNKNINELFQFEILPQQLNQRGIKLVQNNFQQTFDIVNKESKKIILESQTTLMKSNSNATPIAIIINLIDITFISSLRETADRKNRLMAMGEVAANVAHEIRNPLGSIELFASMLKKDFQDDENTSEVITHILSGIKSMNHIISNLLEYAKPRPIKLTDINVIELMNRFLSFSEHLASRQNIEVIKNYHLKKMNIKGDIELLRQVFHNIFLNAIQSMPIGGSIEVVLKNYSTSNLKEMKLFKDIILRNQNHLELILIEFIDNGCGMNLDTKKKIFDPFFTTKARGTGLGMYIIRNVIESHHGIIQVESEIEEGTKISIKIPIATK